MTPSPAPRPIAERVPFDPEGELTRYQEAYSGEISWRDLGQRWRMPDGAIVSEGELLRAEGGIGGPDDD